MRTAAGILMIIAGWFFLVTGVNVLVDQIRFGIYFYADCLFDLFMTIPAMFGIAGGIFCLARKYWKVCFASALLLFVVSAYFLSIFASFWSNREPYDPGSSLSGPPMGMLPPAVMGILPLIFVCLRRKEWQGLDSLRD